MARSYAITRKTVCAICGRPVELVETRKGVALFDDGSGTSPHVCPDEDVSRLRRVWDIARAALRHSRSVHEKPG